MYFKNLTKNKFKVWLKGLKPGTKLKTGSCADCAIARYLLATHPAIDAIMVNQGGVIAWEKGKTDHKKYKTPAWADRFITAFDGGAGSTHSPGKTLKILEAV